MLGVIFYRDVVNTPTKITNFTMAKNDKKKGSLIFSLDLTFYCLCFDIALFASPRSLFFTSAFLMRLFFFFQFFLLLSCAQKSSVDKYDNIIPSYPIPFALTSISSIVFASILFLLVLVRCCWSPSIIVGQHKNEIVLKMWKECACFVSDEKPK